MASSTTTTSTRRSEPLPLTSRKKDLAYFLFFLTHVPIVFLIDAQPLYPPQIHAALPFLTTIRRYYVRNWGDKFLTLPGDLDPLGSTAGSLLGGEKGTGGGGQPPWFKVLLCMEILWHVPAGIWLVRGLWRDNPKTPLVLLPLAVQTAVTSLACMSEIALGWDDCDMSVKVGLLGLYGGYFVLATVMALESYHRLESKLSAIENAIVAEEGRRDGQAGKKMQ